MDIKVWFYRMYRNGYMNKLWLCQYLSGIYWEFRYLYRDYECVIYITRSIKLIHVLYWATLFAVSFNLLQEPV